MLTASANSPGAAVTTGPDVATRTRSPPVVPRRTLTWSGIVNVAPLSADAAAVAAGEAGAAASGEESAGGAVGTVTRLAGRGVAAAAASNRVSRNRRWVSS